MDAVQRSQSDEYSFPYHYIPELRGARSFSAIKRWDFSESYIVALLLAEEWIAKWGPHDQRHLDIGCGDGGFLFHLRKLFPSFELTGVDYDQRAIEWARAFSNEVSFICGDVTSAAFLEEQAIAPFNSASLIEVVEHIPADALPGFMAGVARCLAPGGKLLVTVPHQNKPLEPKHYQHFSFESLRSAVGENFACRRMRGFESRSIIKRAVRRALQNRHVFVEAPLLARLSLAFEMSQVRESETGCGRIVAEFERVS